MRARKILTIALAALTIPAVLMAGTYLSNAIQLGPFWALVSINKNSLNNTTGMVLDAATEKLGYIYFPSTTSPITDIDARFTLTGTSPTFRFGVFADSSRAPNDASQLGGYDSTWTLGATGWTGLKTLSSNTGNLTLNTPVWIVVENTAGTIDASNSIQMNHLANTTTSTGVSREIQRHHNGTNWTTTTAQNVLPLLIVKHNDGTYAGLGLTASQVRSATANDIYVNTGTTQTQGVRFKYGAQIKVLGVSYLLTKSGTPNNLVVTVYEGDTSKYNNTETAGDVVSGVFNTTYFSSPVLLAADTNLFVLLTQTGTSDANDYDLWTYTASSTYRAATAGTDFAFVYGNGTTPSTLTVSTTEIPCMFPIVSVTSTDFDTPASGGSYTFIAGLRNPNPLPTITFDGRVVEVSR